MKRALAAIAIGLALPGTASGNAGIFKGSGHTLRLVGSDAIRLVSEEVTIVPTRGPHVVDGSARGLDVAEYDCRFHLENLTPEAVSVQVGFPLDDEGVRYAKPEAVDADDLVRRYAFICRDAKTTYHVRFVRHDEERKFDSIFVWDMAFDAGEKKDLRVTYRIPVGTGMAPTRKDEGETRPSHPRPWLGHLEGCLAEFFSYVTETGASWAGDVAEARFTVRTAEFEAYLKRRGLFESWAAPDAPDRPDMGGLVRLHRSVQPDGWRATEDGIEWTHAPYEPGPRIVVLYSLVALPNRPDAVEPFVRRLIGPIPTRTDLQVLREVLLAFDGVAPAGPEAKAFVEAQRWYEPKEGATGEGLADAPRAVIARLDEWIAKTP